MEQHEFTYDNIALKSNLHRVLSQLSIHNEKNIRSLKLNLSYRQFLEIHPAKGFKLSWDNVSMKGDVFFRDFNFDTLISPDIINVTLSWRDRKTKSYRQRQFKARFPSGPAWFRVNGSVGEGGKAISEFALSDVKFQKFVTAERITNHYYGYHNILLSFKQKKIFEAGSSPLMDYIAIHRALFNIHQMDMTGFLSLKHNDPDKLVPLLKKSMRAESRKRALSLQQLSKNDLTGVEFAKGLVQLSVSYLKRKNQHQPFIAASYEQMALLVDDPKVFDFYKLVCSRLDKKDGHSTVQLIFDEFVRQAQTYELAEAYAYSLLMLDNATLWAKKMPGVRFYATLLNQRCRTTDGMLASYLKVAAAGFKVGNREMAGRYLDKADELYHEMTKKQPALIHEPLPQFQNMLLQMANQQAEVGNFQALLDLLFRFKNLHFTNDERTILFVLKTKAYNGLFKQNIARAQTAIANGYIDEAYRRMVSLNSFRKINMDYLKQDTMLAVKLEKTAYSLILEFMQRGEILLDKGQSSEAMDNFSKAQGLQNDFLNYRIERLDDLMNQTAIPELLKKIDEAELMVWAKKMDEANKLYKVIIQKRAKYHLEGNTHLNQRVLVLKKKLANRKCIDAGYALDNYLEVAQNRIQSGKWDETVIVMQKAEAIILKSKTCNLDTSLYVQLKRKFGFAVEYSDRYMKMRNKLLAYGYASVWEEFAALDSFYREHHLSNLGVSESGFFELLKNQQNPGNIQSVVRYYLDKDNSLQAFRYLLLLKTLDFSKHDLNGLQIEVGRKMAVQISEKQFENIVNTDDRWLWPLIKTYRSSIH